MLNDIDSIFWAAVGEHDAHSALREAGHQPATTGPHSFQVTGNTEVGCGPQIRTNGAEGGPSDAHEPQTRIIDCH
jgi:hypothetical protein